MVRGLHLLAFFIAAALAGCGALPSKPVQRTLYDFGPTSPATALTAVAMNRAPLVLPDIEASGVLDTTGLLYRLAYEDPHELRPYAYARWSAPPAQLLAQRLRAVLGRDRPVLDEPAATSLARRGANATPPPILRMELQEFSQVFDSPTASRGVLRVRCTLLENTAAGERLVAQRTFEAERPAPSADASGGVRALTAAVDATGQDIAAWLQQQH
jgi:cholesterol transport system auxiliary component